MSHPVDLTDAGPREAVNAVDFNENRVRLSSAYRDFALYPPVAVLTFLASIDGLLS